jgi:pyrimidine operon attenuation protein/uracil phosphoribosyltransferase
VGRNVPTSLRDSVQVRLAEVDGSDEVIIREDL